MNEFSEPLKVRIKTFKKCFVHFLFVFVALHESPYHFILLDPKEIVLIKQKHPQEPS